MKTAKTLNIALQGGGAHGAYSWGVLDRFLEEESLTIEGISGTSAGAMNAAMLAHGFLENGRDGAKETLEKFWKRVSEVAAFSPLRKTPFDRFFTGWNLDASPMYMWFDMMSRVLSPYALNPLNINPLRNVVNEMLDFEKVRACSLMKLFVSATHVASGHARVFQCHEITADVLMASSCLPFLFQAVEIDGEYYWDGGYMGNPAIWPLIYHCVSEDVLLVQINPIHSDKLPKSAPEIIDRLNEITFNSSLIAEMRAIDFVSRLISEGRVERDRYKDMRMHLIYSRDHMKHLTASSKMNADWDFFLFLKDLGRQTADEWIRHHWSDIGERSTVNIREKFLSGRGQPDWGDLSERQLAKQKAKQHEDEKLKKGE